MVGGRVIHHTFFYGDGDAFWSAALDTGSQLRSSTMVSIEGDLTIDRNWVLRQEGRQISPYAVPALIQLVDQGLYETYLDSSGPDLTPLKPEGLRSWFNHGVRSLGKRTPLEIGLVVHDGQDLIVDVYPSGAPDDTFTHQFLHDKLRQRYSGSEWEFGWGVVLNSAIEFSSVYKYKGAGDLQVGLLFQSQQRKAADFTYMAAVMDIQGCTCSYATRPQWRRVLRGGSYPKTEKSRLRTVIGRFAHKHVKYRDPRHFLSQVRERRLHRPNYSRSWHIKRLSGTLQVSGAPGHLASAIARGVYSSESPTGADVFHRLLRAQDTRLPLERDGLAQAALAPYLWQ